MGKTKVSCQQKVLTREEFGNEQNPHHALEGQLPDTATAFVAPLTDIQHVVAPEDPGGNAEEEREWHDQRGRGGVHQAH